MNSPYANLVLTVEVPSAVTVPLNMIESSSSYSFAAPVAESIIILFLTIFLVSVTPDRTLLKSDR